MWNGCLEDNKIRQKIVFDAFMDNCILSSGILITLGGVTSQTYLSVK